MTSPSFRPEVTSFFDPVTATITHIVRDPASRKVAIIDPVLDYDPKSGVRSTGSADKIVERVQAEGLDVEWLLETHIHADHLSGAPYLKNKLGGRSAVGRHISDVQETWNGIFNYKEGLETDPSLFDHLFDDGDRFRIGELEAEVWYTPGHTAIDLTYVIGDAAFIGDTLFMPDYGTARCDFPGGDARALWRSTQRILSLPDSTRLFLCHDYLPKVGRKEFATMTTVAEQRRNIMLADLDEETFVARRQERDKGLAVPMLLYPSLQVNIRAGNPPPAEDNGVSYIKVPLRDRADS